MHALEISGLEKLEERRVKLCDNFARKASKHPKYKTWFCTENNHPPKVNTRAKNKKGKTLFKPVETRTDRFKNSPLPYLTALLNKTK